MSNRTNSMKSIRLAISLIVMALLVCSCGGKSLSGLPGKSYSVGTDEVKPLISLYAVQPTGEHVLALIYAYQSLVPGDYSSDLFTALSSSSTLIDADGTQYRPIHIYAISCFPASNKPLFDQFTNSGTIPCNKATNLKTVMILYAADSEPATKLTLTLGDGSTIIDIASPVNDQIAYLQGR
jgi:hypothetical protein